MSDTYPKRLKKLSSPFATGGGGNNFERRVQALCLLSLLVDGFAPVINCPISKLHFQAKHAGIHTDDLVIESVGPTGIKKVYCQIKNDIRVTKQDKQFQEVITAAWYDYRSDWFNSDIDRIAVIANVDARATIRSLRQIHEQATVSEGAGDFLQRIGQSNFIHSETRKRFEVLRYCLNKAKGGEVSEEELYGFCKAFVFVMFDGNSVDSVHEALCQSLIRCKSDTDPREVWSTLTEYAGTCNQAAATITKDSIPFHIKELFGYKGEETDFFDFQPTEMWSWIVLIGAWNENNTEDKQAIERIIGTDYTRFLAFARDRLNSGDPYISLTDGVWRVSFRKDIFPMVRDFLFDDIIRNAFTVASQFITELNKRFDRNDPSSLFITPPGGCFTHSDAFRKGLCEGLCILTNSSPPKYSTYGLVTQQSSFLIHVFFGKCTWKTFAGIEELLRVLSELSPDVFLKELESYIVHQSQELKMLFPQKTHMHCTENYMTQILWALEALAWVPKYFNRCVCCLGMIEALGYEATNYGNKPITSMITILNAFRPQTYASIQQMENAIIALKKDSEEICWEALEKLLPESSFTFVETPKPRFIDITSFDHEITKSDSSNLLQYYVKTAIELASGSAKRIASLSKHIRYMSEDMILDYLHQIIDTSPSWTDEMRYHVWDSLCDLKVRTIVNNEHSEPDTPAFGLLNDAIIVSTPTSKCFRYMRLFNKRFDEFNLDYTQNLDTWKAREVAKTKAVLDLYHSFGIDEVISFGARLHDLSDVGKRLGQGLNCLQMKEVLLRYSNSSGSKFYPAVLRGFLGIQGIHRLKEIGLEYYEEPFRAKVLCTMPLAPEVMSLLDDFLTDNSAYWKNVPVFSFSPDWSQDAIDSAIRELANVGRYDAIINTIGYCVDKANVPEELLKSVLIHAASEVAFSQLESPAICCIIKELQAKPNPDIDTLVEIEYAYLPFLMHSSTQPKALFYKIANDSGFFCSLMEIAYKPHHGKRANLSLPDGVSQRLSQLLINFCIVPGIDWNGNLKVSVFREWIDSVLQWAEKADRMAVVQQTIGNGLSYADTEDGLPDDVIMEVLNAPRNMDMRIGYRIGIQNKREAYWDAPDHSLTHEIGQQYCDYANAAEKLGYGRFAETLRAISNDYNDYNGRKSNKL